MPTFLEQRYCRKHLRCVRHITLDPKGRGAVRIHMIPPREDAPDAPFLLLLNGSKLVPLNLSWAILLSCFMDRLEPFAGLEITEIYDNNGQFAKPNITLKDGDGKTIQLYKAVVADKTALKVGDKLDVTAAVGVFNTTLQLRNTVSDEVKAARQSGIITTLSDGDTIVIFNPANGKALSTEYTGFYNQGTDVKLADGKLTGYTKKDIWTVGVNADGTYTFSTADGDKLSMDTSYTSTPLNKVNDTWKVVPAKTADCFYVDNATRTDKYRLQWFAKNNNWSAYTGTGPNF